jgi:hypothetical protein
MMVPCFIISCVDNKGQGEKAVPEVEVPPALEPSANEGVTTSTGSGRAEGSGQAYDAAYSPGNNDWTLPTQEEQDKWDHDVYVVALEKWAKPRLDNWTCRSCKGSLSKNFKFKDRDGNNIRFECKCDCGHTHTVTLQGTQ